MKKSVIKRRKRVVPAANEPDSSHLQQTSFTVSSSPQPHPLETHNLMRQRLGSSIDHHSPLDLRPNPHLLDASHSHEDQRRYSSTHPSQPQNIDPRQRQQSMEHQHHFDPPPIGVDFTGYQLINGTDRRPSTIQQPPPHQQQLPPVSSLHPEPRTRTSDSDSHARLSPFGPTRKRSRSVTEKSSPSSPAMNNTNDPNRPRLSSISQILNAPQQVNSVEDGLIDPHLSTLPPHLQQHRHSSPLPHQQPSLTGGSQVLQRGETLRQSTSSDPGGWTLTEKKARLRREAEQIRDILRGKEREIEELERLTG